METLTFERVASWERVAFATGPGGDPESAVRQAYREAGLAEPERVITLGSPAAGALAAAWLTGDASVRRTLAETGLVADVLLRMGESNGLEAGRSVREEIRTRPWAAARAAACEALGHDGWSARWAETGGRIWPRVERIVGDIRRAVGDLGGESLRHHTLDAVLGQHDAPWLSAFDGLDGLGRVAGCAGWWWPFERVAIVTGRPAEIHLDELGRLHRADGPALAYPDGFALHAWHGMPVPADFGAAMTGLTAERIREEQNAELRRVMLEHFGFERYLADSGARPVQRDETGRLWRIDLADDEPIAMVEVVNSTPEPDGTSRTYFLRVPPWVSRARQGVAWTFGLTEEGYHPERET
ncbi:MULTISPECIES: DUF6745 domain-containing protein [Nonomuraea]|uniref:DUF6745 domain-containing protein n=1 Tax=Nonomuraea ferruginea TaxID=46174 RepID=A0ABT4T2P4_9ACTN|nr:hypothetical protein [Nonomuraea ferruginea]MDA0643778.1 hypothetical protein [Nonomuraea ferruginea]